MMQLLKDCLRLKSSLSIASLLVLSLLFPFGGKAQDINLGDEKSLKLYEQAEKAEEARQFGEAEAIWREMLRLNSGDDAEVHYRLCRVLNLQNKLDEAVAACRQAVQLQSDEPAYHFLLGVVFRRQKQFDDAIVAFRRTIQLDPQRNFPHYNLGLALYGKGENSEAIKAFREAIRINPKHAQAHQGLGNALAGQNQFNEAINALRRAIELDSQNPVFHKDLGFVFLEQDKLDEAVLQFHQATEVNPKYAFGYFGLGLALKDQNKLDEAIKAFRQSIELDSNNDRAHYQLGSALLDQNKPDEAIKAFRDSIRLNSESADVHNDLGVALGKQKKLDEEINAYRKAIALNPEYALAHRNLAIALRKQNKLDEANLAIRKAINLNPKDADAHFDLGIVLSEQNQLDQAVAVLQKASELAPQSGRVQYQLGWTLGEQRKFGEAIASYRKAISLGFDNALVYVEMAIALAQQEKLDQAVIEARRALEKPDPSGDRRVHALAHNIIGAVLRESGKLEAAIAEIEKAIALNPKLDLSQNNLAEAKRLLVLKRNPQSVPIKDDQLFLPSATSFPLVNTYRSIVRIVAKGIKGMEVGTGWVVKREGDTLWIVTNRHVVSNGKTPSNNISLEFYSQVPADKRFRYKATIEHLTSPTQDPDKDLDLAVLKVVGVPSDIKPLELFNDDINPATSIRVIGHRSDEPWSIVTGEVMNVMPDQPRFSLNVNVAKGNSGSPVINEKGQVIGMIMIMRTAEDLDFNPDEPDESPQLATGGIAPAYQIDAIVQQLRNWRILN